MVDFNASGKGVRAGEQATGRGFEGGRGGAGGGAGGVEGIGEVVGREGEGEGKDLGVQEAHFVDPFDDPTAFQ